MAGAGILISLQAKVHSSALLSSGFQQRELKEIQFLPMTPDIQSVTFENAFTPVRQPLISFANKGILLTEGLPMGAASRQQQATFWGWDAAETLHRVELDASQYPKAVCNDGSRGTYYVKRNRDSKVWLVYLEGAGWCWDQASCQERELMKPRGYHSSLQMPTTKQKAGIFSPDPSISPLADANKV